MAPPEWRANGGPILSNNGGSILSNNGGSILANNGSGIVAQGGGLISPGTGIPTGGKWLRPGEVGADLVAHGSGSLISPGTGIPTGGKWLRPEEPLEGARIRAFSATGAIAKDAQGQALEARSDAQGHFAFAQAPVGPGPYLLQAEGNQGQAIVAAIVGSPNEEFVSLNLGTTLAVSYLAGVTMLSGLEGLTGVSSDVLLAAVDGVSTKLIASKRDIPWPIGPSYVNQLLAEMFDAYPEVAIAMEKLSSEVNSESETMYRLFSSPVWLGTSDSGNLMVLEHGNGGRIVEWTKEFGVKTLYGPDSALTNVQQISCVPGGGWIGLSDDFEKGYVVFDSTHPISKAQIGQGAIWTSACYVPNEGILLADGENSIWKVERDKPATLFSSGWFKPKYLCAGGSGEVWVGCSDANNTATVLRLKDGERTPMGFLPGVYWGPLDNDGSLPLRFLTRNPIEEGSLYLGWMDRACRLRKPERWVGHPNVFWAFIFGETSPFLNGPRLGGNLKDVRSGVWIKDVGLVILAEGKIVVAPNALSDIAVEHLTSPEAYSDPSGGPISK